MYLGIKLMYMKQSRHIKIIKKQFNAKTDEPIINKKELWRTVHEE